MYKKANFQSSLLLKKLQVLHASPTTNKQTTCSIFLRPAGSSMYGHHRYTVYGILVSS